MSNNYKQRDLEISKLTKKEKEKIDVFLTDKVNNYVWWFKEKNTLFMFEFLENGLFKIAHIGKNENWNFFSIDGEYSSIKSCIRKIQKMEQKLGWCWE